MIDNTDVYWALLSALVHRSELKYESGDYKGAIDDKYQAKRLIISHSHLTDLKTRFKQLIRKIRFAQSKYDLIQDYKTRLDHTKKLEIISKLEKISELKYESGDYKGSIRAMRRAEKYL
tara:strand:- start:44 stop:400 length:357 start_codon:yes stop_codon:yes gene_type:complete